MKKTIKKIAKAFGLWLYKVSGLKALVSWIESKVLNYRLRIRMIPVSYKLFLVGLGIALSSGWMIATENYRAMTNDPAQNDSRWVFENDIHIQAAQAKESPIQVTTAHQGRSVEELADYIWMKESSRGKNNFSKCEEDGKINGIGYGIPGNGDYVCFNSHEEEMTVLKGWIVTRQAYGWSEIKMLCTYSGNNYSECKK